MKPVLGVAVDGQPLVASNRRLAAAEPQAAVRGLAAVVRAVGAARGLFAAAAPDAADALRRAGAEVVLIPDEMPPALPEAAFTIETLDLVDLGGDAVVTLAGGVAAPRVVRLPIGTSVEDALAAAGGATCGPAWVALAGGPLGRPVDRDEVIDARTRALYFAAAGSDLVRRARRRMEPFAAAPLGIPARLLGVTAPEGRLSRALVARRLGLDCGDPPWAEPLVRPA